jgi:hypothetical protein
MNKSSLGLAGGSLGSVALLFEVLVLLPDDQLQILSADVALTFGGGVGRRQGIGGELGDGGGWRAFGVSSG